MTISTTLTARSHNAAEYIKKVGWTQNRTRDLEGRVCETGAVMYCQPKNGDEHIIIAVLRNRGTGEKWNDKEGRIVEQVVADLNRDITDAELAATFGPQWVELVALVRACAGLTKHQSEALGAAREAAAATAEDESENAAWGAARGEDWWAAKDAAWNATWTRAGAAAGNAAGALVTRDLIGQHGYTQEHYDTLTAPWVSVMGKVHPDDTTPKES